MKVECFQGVGDKLVELKRIATSLRIIKSRILAIGNELNDLRFFLATGLSLCPTDAAPEIKSSVDLVLPIKGGDGILYFLARVLEKQTPCTAGAFRLEASTRDFFLFSPSKFF
jgi:3-deoxy-D-manno-octulosonate 8-phosphate phosphatase KdsC-like HAD superfamily phosphatase